MEIGILRRMVVGTFLLISYVGFSQNPERKFIDYEISGTEIHINTSDGKYELIAYTPEIFETTFLPKGQEEELPSHAVVLEPSEVIINVSEKDGNLFIDTEGINISIIKNPFQIIYSYMGKEVISEKTGYAAGKEHEKIDFNITDQEILMGGGARAMGMNRRGNRLRLYNQAHYGYETTSELMNYSLPIVFSSQKYLLHFDNAPIGYLDLDSGNTNTLAYETIGGRKTYQVIVGETWEQIVSNYTLLTGRQPMPPRWALGNYSSRFGYHSQKEVTETVERFKQEEIPVDAVILDLFWFGHDIKGTMGNLEFVRDSFPEPEQMMRNLAKEGIKTILVTEPFILTTSNRWKEAVEEEVLATDASGKPYTFDFYFGNSGLIDIFKPKAREWFWNIYKDLAEMGVDGWWGDLGEPEAHPAEIQHMLGSANEVHNIYGHYWAKLIYEGYREDFPDTRPFILMRAGAAGSQRFGLIPWSGDVNRSWGGLQSQPEIALQMGVQGLGYMHSDLGGFAGNLLDDELYTRWLQYGVFQPIYRPHAQEEVPSEPVFREPKTKALAKKSIELRYRLLPYNYNLAFQNSETGIPLMRPIFFEEPDNRKVYEIADTYLWGRDFLISPVMTSGLKEKEIYFPATGNWFDFYTGQKIRGGTSQTVAVNEENIPTFVRGGAFIPAAKPVKITENFSAAIVEAHYYYDDESGKSQGFIYHDDGKTANSYQKGLYEMVRLEADNKPTSLNFTISREKGWKFTPEVEVVDLFIENLKKPVKFVWVNGLKYTSKNYMHRGNLVIPVRFEYGEKNNIRIEF